MHTCVLNLVSGIIAVLTLVPLITLMRKHFKYKKYFCHFMKSKKMYLLLSMIFLDIYVAMNSLINMGKLGWDIRNPAVLMTWLLRGFSIYMIIYFVFKKASKIHINKNKWLFILKLIFVISMVIIFSLAIHQIIEN